MKRRFQLGPTVLAVLGIGMMPLPAGAAGKAAGCAENATENPETPSPCVPSPDYSYS